MNWILKVDRGKKVYYLEKKFNVYGLIVGKIFKKSKFFKFWVLVEFLYILNVLKCDIFKVMDEFK